MLGPAVTMMPLLVEALEDGMSSWRCPRVERTQGGSESDPRRWREDRPAIEDFCVLTKGNSESATIMTGGGSGAELEEFAMINHNGSEQS